MTPVRARIPTAEQGSRRIVATTAIRALAVCRRFPTGLLVAFAGLGTLAIVLVGTTIGSNPRPHHYRWWLGWHLSSYTTSHVVLYLGVATLTLAWAALGVHAFDGRLGVARSWAALAVTGLPLLVGVPMFSRDLYSYVAEGELVRHHLNPYLVAPRALGAGPLLSSIAVVWRHTTSPYGPLFVVLAHASVLVGGHSLMTQIIALRILELIGVAMMMYCLPVIARHVGVEPGVSIWLGVLSPLALFSAVSSAHNDTLMIGVMLVALVVSLRGARRGALALFALAATIKLPALAGSVFILVGPWRAASWRQRTRLVGEAVVISGAVIVAVTLIAGYGWTWLSPSALKIPTELHVLTTPVVSVAVLLATGLHALGWHVATRHVVNDVQPFVEVFGVLVVLWMLVRTTSENHLRRLGVALLVVVIASPTVWPWYFLWGVTILGATSAQRSRFLALVAGLAMLLVGPGGTPMIGGNGFYVTGPAVLLALAWFASSGQWRRVLNGVDRVD
jgi:hypothetical protein